MAWNAKKSFSDNNKETKIRINENSFVRFLCLNFIGLSVICLIILLVKCNSDDFCRGKKLSRHVSSIKECVPAVTNRICDKNSIDKDISPDARPTKFGEKINGYVLLPNGQLHKVLGETRLMPSKHKSAIFDYPADNIIAGILSMEPGDTVLGTANYNGRFVRAFLKSLQAPIIVQDSDPDEVKELKRAVIEAKIELKDAYERGDDIEEMILNAREEFRDLAQYKLDLRKELLRYANRDASSSEDVDDYMKAVNIMLERRGIAPIDDIPFARIKLQMRESWEDNNE